MYNIQGIKLINAVGDGMNDCIVGYDADACLSGVDYFWSTPEGSDGAVTEAGWTEFMGDTLVTDVTCPLGTGFYLQILSEPGDGKTVNVQYSGEVFTGTLIREVPQVGYNMIGNSTPVEIDLQDLKLIDAVGDGMNDCIVGYDADACLSGVDYFWSTPEGSDGTVTEAGWTEFMGDTLIEGIKLQPGQGVYVQILTDLGDEKKVSYSIPSPIKE